MAAQCLEEWLEAAAYDATQGPTMDLDVADSRRQLQALGGRRSDEGELYSLSVQFLSHGPSLRRE